MKIITNKRLTKNLIIVLIIVTIMNFLVPNFAYADTDTEGGGDLLEAIAKFVAFLCDKVMQWLQETFVSSEDIEAEEGTYNFQYSPAIIFSGTVPALDINFIKPKENSATEFSEEVIKRNIKEYVEMAESDSNNEIGYFDVADGFIGEDLLAQGYNRLNLSQEADSFFDYLGIELIVVYWKADKAIFYIYEAEVDFPKPYKAYRLETDQILYKKSTAKELQGTIATWYKVLRRIALVGLLSVLVYIGIRMVLTATSPQDKSKYKKMLVDWFAALCLLFTLHYIMNFTITVTNEISSIFNTGETDDLLNTLRADIYSGTSWSVVTGEVIMYVALTVLTITFTVRYIKRVIYMAFFTMIAPLITLTYPLDKIKDGQAQAFGMWIKEYVFNALIQVVHLVIYYVLVGSAIELVKNYTLYAILVIMFMKQAENIVRKMFGFDKAETIGTLGAAATGGLLMNAINSMKKPPKSSESEDGEKGGKAGSGSGKGGNVRTASNDPLSGLRNGASNNTSNTSNASSNMSAGGNTGNGVNATRTAIGATGDGALGEGITRTAGNSESGEVATGASSSNTTSGEKPKRNIKGAAKTFRKGVWGVTKRYAGPAMRKVTGATLGVAGGVIGFSAGVAQGDIGKALAGAAGGATAGYYTGQKAVNMAGKGIHTVTHANEAFDGIRDAWNEGAHGTEYAQNAKFDREFKRSDTYRALREKNFSEENIDAILDAGITDKKAMEKILNNSNGDISKAIGYYTLAKQCPDDIYCDDNKLQKYLQSLGLSETDAETMRRNMKKFRA